MKKIIFHLMPMILLLLIGLISSCEKEEIQHDITPQGPRPGAALAQLVEQRIRNA